MTDHEIAARAALNDLLDHHRQQITRIEAAIAALNGDVIPLVRPPAPDIIAPPVEMPKVPQREQRPAAKSSRSTEGVRTIAAQRANCPDCGKEFSQLGIGPHRRAAHGRTVTPTPAPPPSAPLRSTADVLMPVLHAPTGKRVFVCEECDAEFDTSDIGALSNHCLHSHSRRPSIGERMPVTARGAA